MSIGSSQFARLNGSKNMHAPYVMKTGVILALTLPYYLATLGKVLTFSCGFADAQIRSKISMAQKHLNLSLVTHDSTYSYQYPQC